MKCEWDVAFTNQQYVVMSSMKRLADIEWPR